MKHRLVTLVLMLGIILAVASPARAHAVLVRSSPDANAALPRAPAQVELFFSEGLEPSFSTVSVLDSNGAIVDNGDARVDSADPTRLTVSVRSLPVGVYTVSWKALSATDGHLTTGSFPFGVGDVEASALAAAAPATRTVTLSLGEVIAKWLLYLAVAILMGGALFSLGVWQPACRLAEVDPSLAQIMPERRLSTAALAMFLLASVLGLLVQAGQASGAEIASPWSNAVNGVLLTSRYGVLWIVRLACGLGLAGLLPRAQRSRDLWVACGLALALALTISLGSHAAAEPQPGLPVLADWIHLVSAGVWVGGLVHFAAGLWNTRGLEAGLRTRLTARLIPRFSALALTSVAALALSGLYAAILRVGTWVALTQTLYGQVLITKLILATLMVGLGAVNLLIVTPNMKRAATTPLGGALLVDRFRRIVASEVTLGAALLLSVGVLTSAPPARLTATTPALTTSANADDLHLNLEITPGRVGLNTFTVTVTAEGQAVSDAGEVVLQFTPSQASVAPSRAQLTPQGNGQYSIKGAFFSLPSTWQVQVVVRREGQFDAYANFSFEVGTPAGAQAFPWSRVAGVLILLAALAYAFAISRLSHTRSQFLAAGGLPALVLVVVGLVAFNRPAAAEQAGPANPIPPNAQSTAAGRALFQANCVPCHGASGKGDGPVGLTLNPHPADLTLHAVPGVHSDGQLYQWITGGFPGSVMPAFDQSLSDQDRWNLVNYIRTLAPQ